MKLEIDMPEHHYNNIIAFDSVSLGRVPYKGIIMYTINAIKHGKVLEQEPFINKPCVSSEVCEHDKQIVLDNIRAEIKEKIEQEEFARSVFRHEEKDTAKAEQCTGSIMAYNKLIKLIDKYKAESEK